MKKMYIKFIIITFITGVFTLVSCESSGDEFYENGFFELCNIENNLDGLEIRALEFDSKGNAWIGTCKHGIIRYNKKGIEVYNSDNSAIPKDFLIWDIAIDKKDNVWIGYSGEGLDGGLLKYDGNTFTKYNSKNTAMPEDIVWDIEVDSKNNLWIASCRIRQGGLVKYDGTEWTVYTPSNSVLPVNDIHSIAIDQSDNVWLALGEYVGQGSLVKISNNEWNVYTEKELGFQPYYWDNIQCDSKNRLWGSLSYVLSSFSGPHFPNVIIFDGEKTTLLSYDDLPGITLDINNYVWYIGNGLWIDNRWTKLNNSKFRGKNIYFVKESLDHRIWIVTEDGIYIK